LVQLVRAQCSRGQASADLRNPAPLGAGWDQRALLYQRVREVAPRPVFAGTSPGDLGSHGPPLSHRWYQPPGQRLVRGPGQAGPGVPGRRQRWGFSPRSRTWSPSSSRTRRASRSTAFSHRSPDTQRVALDQRRRALCSAHWRDRDDWQRDRRQRASPLLATGRLSMARTMSEALPLAREVTKRGVQTPTVLQMEAVECKALSADGHRGRAVRRPT
jgi:hypothetical protein